MQILEYCRDKLEGVYQSFVTAFFFTQSAVSEVAPVSAGCYHCFLSIVGCFFHSGRAMLMLSLPLPPVISPPLKAPLTPRRLLIVCDNQQYGCSVVVNLDRLESHLKECEHNPKRPVQCEQGCGMVVPMDEVKVRAGVAAGRLTLWVYNSADVAS